MDNNLRILHRISYNKHDFHLLLNANFRFDYMLFD